VVLNGKKYGYHIASLIDLHNIDIVEQRSYEHNRTLGLLIHNYGDSLTKMYTITKCIVSKQIQFDTFVMHALLTIVSCAAIYSSLT
jgi:hypothetical protein